MPITVTTQEILDEIRRVQAATDTDGFTCRELGQALGVGVEPTRRRIRLLWDAGLVASVRLRRPYMDGRLSIVPGYRLLKPAKCKRA